MTDAVSPASAPSKSPRRRLLVMRHAKSSWATPQPPDHARPLNQRGRLAAVLMGAWIAETAGRIDHAVISTSVRTRETWDQAGALLPEPPPETRFKAALYLAEPATLLETVRALPDTAGSALIMGHNPGIEQFAARLSAADGPKSGAFPTAAVALFELTTEGDWRSSSFGGFRLLAFEQPKSLV